MESFICFIPQSSIQSRRSDQVDQVSLHANGEACLRHRRPTSTAVHTRQKLTNKSKCEFHTTSSETTSHDTQFAYLQCSIGFLKGTILVNPCVHPVFKQGHALVKGCVICMCKKRKFAYPTADEVCGQTPL